METTEMEKNLAVNIDNPLKFVKHIEIYMWTRQILVNSCLYVLCLFADHFTDY